jgi:hypothetical protein
LLSQEDRRALTPEQLAVAFSEASRAARKLATSLVKGERCEDPKAHLNAPNPADGIRIRIIRPQPPSITYGDDDRVRAHNLFVSSLGKEGTRFGS